MSEVSALLKPEIVSTFFLAVFFIIIAAGGVIWFKDSRPARKARLEMQVEMDKKNAEADLQSKLAHAEFAVSAKECMAQQTDLMGRVVDMQEHVRRDVAEIHQHVVVHKCGRPSGNV